MVQGDSPEAVAYALMQSVLCARGQGDGMQVYRLAEISGERTPIPEGELLSLYHRCLATVLSRTAVPG
jgi:hypothetical protein